MIKITRNNNIRIQGHAGVFGMMELTSRDGETLRLFTREKPWLSGKRWPYGKPIDSCIKDGKYEMKYSYALKYNRIEIFLYNPDLGVYVSSADTTSAIDRYGALFIVGDTFAQAEGAIQLGMDITHTSSNYSLIGGSTAHSLFRGWLEAHPEETEIQIKWGKTRFI